MDKPIIVTGAAGFIGGHLADKLASIPGQWVIGVDKEKLLRRVSWTEVKCRVGCRTKSTEGLFASALNNASTIYHLAASISAPESVEKPQEYFENNVLGTAWLVNMCLKYNPEIHFVFASSASVYGCTSEDYNLKPYSPYAKSKVAGEEIVKQSGLSYSIARFFNIYGPRQRSNFVPLAYDRIKSGSSIDLYAEGFVDRDYVYIDDCIDNLIDMAANKVQMRDVGTGIATTNKYLVNQLNWYMNKDNLYNHLNLLAGMRQGDPLYSCSRHKTCLTPISEGLRKYVEYRNANPEHY